MGLAFRLLVLIHFAALCLLVGSFSPFTFNIIIDRYVLIVILLTVFWLFCSYFFLSSFTLFPCDLMTIFIVMLGFFSLFCVSVIDVWFVVYLAIYRGVYVYN